MSLKSVRRALLASVLAGLNFAGWSQPSTGPDSESVRVLVLPNGETVLASPVGGRITEIHTGLGRAFRQGAVLVSLECGEHEARAGMAKADLAAATEEYEAKLRMQGLEQASDVEVALAASAVAKAKAQSDLIQFQISQCAIRAPWDGYTSRLHVRSHMTVTPGQPMLDLVRRGVLLLKLNVPSRWTSGLRIGQEFEVTIDETGKSYPARVQRINSRIDPVSQTIELEAALLRVHPDLLPGMSGVARFQGMR
ncbi:MAG TPA: efflux RND transporter periplasmic adaptor subunit [Hydrogenophaga sp.]|uniref:efflux RND transporter periplasmic adaptor subunit n=1 Tax=Hydrogenophaga sp. TaxID=1904254 RepID=UPI002C80CB3D|nr:efflux RND transporter periplasmic adaptor subunit [Hydrogenophaga sp.]HMN93380.1 efflux RND transporter periplasmic adaptor subunit [Hydrogenophaga sp.]HMN94194.1 efflux RND transporter periplasmic adaptor subunit [Hydrogenophaga sp.]